LVSADIHTSRASDPQIKSDTGATHSAVAETDANKDLDQSARFTVERVADALAIQCAGNWTISSINAAHKELGNLPLEGLGAVSINSSGVTDFDTAGAWLIERLRLACVQAAVRFEHQDADPRHSRLVQVIAQEKQELPTRKKARVGLLATGLEKTGHATVEAIRDFSVACYLVGASVRGPQLKEGRRGGIRLTSIVHHLDQMGLRAIPVIGVMSFLIGAIIAQQGAYQLKFYGEELLMVNLVGILHFREIGVLLTAIMVAGRSGSAITAEIGTMKMREEIDALTVIGLNPVGVLISPRLVALIIALPILVLLSDAAGIAGAIVVGELYVGITPEQFLLTLKSGVEIKHIFVGFIKAPVMAIIIGLAAAVEGLKVGGSAESLGQRTTAAVVRAIFAVIVVDGLFAMFFAAIGY
jgi:phospholipid/cholesterol/gamma-HCH transport system permease protein